MYPHFPHPAPSLLLEGGGTLHFMGLRLNDGFHPSYRMFGSGLSGFGLFQMVFDAGVERPDVRAVGCGSFDIAFFKTPAPDIFQRAPVITVGYAHKALHFLLRREFVEFFDEIALCLIPQANTRDIGGVFVVALRGMHEFA